LVVVALLEAEGEAASEEHINKLYKFTLSQDPSDIIED
jgi:hypothetical protein